MEATISGSYQAKFQVRTTSTYSGKEKLTEKELAGCRGCKLVGVIWMLQYPTLKGCCQQ